MGAGRVITLPRAADPRVSILVVAAHVKPRLLRCLESLARAAPAIAFDTSVLLDGVDEETARALREQLSGVRVEAFPTGLGLAGVLNRGRELVRGEFLVTLQDDTEVRSGWLEGLVQAADQDPGAGAVGSLVLNPDGSVQVAGYELTPDFSARPPWGERVPDPSEFDAVRPVDYCGSCSLLVRTATWDLIGGADERIFPLYPVDIDICLAIRMRGQRVLCAPASVLVHERGASITPDFAGFVQRRHRELMLEKWGAALVGHVPGSGAVRELPAAELPLQVREPDPDRQAIAQLIRARDTLRDYARELSSRLDAQEEELAWLRERAATLARVEAGGWWQLRRRVLPALRLAGALRRRLRARR
jgi:GT2 family glycosyltransferase